MWTRFHIKCNNCEKVTNLRIQVPEKETMPVSLDCMGCSSELRAILLVDFEKTSLDFKVERGSLVHCGVDSGDFFHEFSDTLVTGKPSDEPHDPLLPTFRIPTKKLFEYKKVKDGRKLIPEEVWEDFKDLTRSYVRCDKPVVEKLVLKLMGDILPASMLSFSTELAYHRSYFLTLDFLTCSWVDYESHIGFVRWLCEDVFNKSNAANSNLLDYVENVTSDDVCGGIRKDIGELTLRFADLRNFFYYANMEDDGVDSFAAVQDFTMLKNFYTDCFEFMGRTSHLVFRLQNFRERGSQDKVPDGCPRNVTSATTFASLDHGQKLDVLTLSDDMEPKLLYLNSFDSKLRNGINHFKTKFDNADQVISYYPITRKPDEEYRIKYIDFLNLTLKSYSSVLKIGQLIKVATEFGGPKDQKRVSR